MNLLYGSYAVFISNNQQVESRNDFRLFLHVIYEIDTSIRFLIDCFLEKKDQFNQID